MDVSIVICTCNRRDKLRQMLDVVGRVQVPEGLRCELIVIDNNSTDGTADLVKSVKLENNIPIGYLFEPRSGKCFALNVGLDAARGRFLMFTDDDVRPPVDWIEGMCAPMLAGNADAVAGGVRIAPHLERPWMGWMHRAWLASTDKLNPADPAYMVGANMAFSKEVLSRVPAFDEELGPGALGFHDELLFTLQLKQAGYKVVSAFGVTVEHHFDESRLLRLSFDDMARKMARSSAYSAHHWEHEDVRHPYFQLVLAHLRLAKWRLLRGHECKSAEGMPEWEMIRLRHIYFLRQYLTERRRPRNYQKHGLVKLNHGK